MKKFALTTLAVMAAIGVLAVQPADAKKVQQDPSMAIIDMPMNEKFSKSMVYLNLQIKKHNVYLIS